MERKDVGLLVARVSEIGLSRACFVFHTRSTCIRSRSYNMEFVVPSFSRIRFVRASRVEYYIYPFPRPRIISGIQLPLLC